jgi:hypothetical protein
VGPQPSPSEQTRPAPAARDSSHLIIHRLDFRLFDTAVARHPHVLSSLTSSHIMSQLKGDQSKSRDMQSKSGIGNSKQAKQERKVDVRTRHHELVTELFDEELATELTNEDSLDITKYITKYENVLLKSDGFRSNLLHLLILKLNTVDQDAMDQGLTPKKVSRGVLDLVDHLVINKPDLFTEVDRMGVVPLSAAAENKVEILFRVLSLVIPESTRKRITAEKCDKEQKECPLQQVHKRRREQCPNTSPHGSPDAAKTPPREHDYVDISVAEKPTGPNEPAPQNGCLHVETNVKELLEQDTKLRDTLEKALSSPKNGQWPVLQHLLVAANVDKANAENPRIPLDNFKLLLQLCPDEVFNSPAQGGYSPLQMAIQLYKESAVDYSHLFSIIEALVEKSRGSIYFEFKDSKSDEKKTAYRLLRELDTADKSQKSNDSKTQELNQKKEDPERKASRENTEELLKMACIGTPEKDLELEAKLDFLYWKDAHASKLPNCRYDCLYGVNID